MAKQTERRRIRKPIRLQSNPDNMAFGWSVFVLVVFCSVLTGLAALFFTNLHYSNQIINDNNEISSYQTQVKSEQHDIQFIIEHDNTQINCYELNSSYDRNICNSHNQ